MRERERERENGRKKDLKKESVISIPTHQHVAKVKQKQGLHPSTIVS